MKNILQIFLDYLWTHPKSRLFLLYSLSVVYHRPLEWLWDILLCREIYSQSSNFKKIKKIENFLRVRKKFVWFSIWSKWKVIKQIWLDSRYRFSYTPWSCLYPFLPKEKCNILSIFINFVWIFGAKYSLTPKSYISGYMRPREEFRGNFAIFVRIKPVTI